MSARPTPPPGAERIHCPDCGHFLANFEGTYLEPKPCHNCHMQAVVWSSGGTTFVEAFGRASAEPRKRVDRIETTRHDSTNRS